MEKMRQLNIRVKRQLFERLSREAKRAGRGVSEVARSAIDEYLQKREGNVVNYRRYAKDPIRYRETRYSRLGIDYTALYVAWSEVERILGGPHTGDPEEDKALVQALMYAGAPNWARDAEGWVDEYGWGLIGPCLGEEEKEWEA